MRNLIKVQSRGRAFAWVDLDIRRGASIESALF